MLGMLGMLGVVSGEVQTKCKAYFDVILPLNKSMTILIMFTMEV